MRVSAAGLDLAKTIVHGRGRGDTVRDTIDHGAQNLEGSGAVGRAALADSAMNKTGDGLTFVVNPDAHSREHQ